MDIIMSIHATLCSNNITERIFKLFQLIKKWQCFKSFDLCTFFAKIAKILKIQNAAISLLIGII